MHWNKILNHYFCIAAVIYTTILYTNKLILGLKSINLTWQVTELTNDYFRSHFTNFHSLLTKIWLESSWPLLPCLLIAFDLNSFHHRGIQGPCFYCLNFWWTAASFIIWLTNTDGMAVTMSVMPEMQRACHFHMLPSYRPTGRMCSQQTWQQAETVLHQQVLTMRDFI